MRRFVVLVAGLAVVVTVAVAVSGGATDANSSQMFLRIDGAAASDEAGWSVAGAGDVNGDGLADVLVGAPGFDSGSAYIVLGTRSPARIDLASLGGGGFRIDGAAQSDRAGASVAGAGDVNGETDSRTCS